MLRIKQKMLQITNSGNDSETLNDYEKMLHLSTFWTSMEKDLMLFYLVRFRGRDFSFHTLKVTILRNKFCSKIPTILQKRTIQIVNVWVNTKQLRKWNIMNTKQRSLKKSTQKQKAKLLSFCMWHCDQEYFVRSFTHLRLQNVWIEVREFWANCQFVNILRKTRFY